MKTKFYLNGKKTTRKALFTVCGPLWRVLRAGGCLPPLPPQGPAVDSGRGRCGRFLFRFQGAYVKGAAVDSPCADG